MPDHQRQNLISVHQEWLGFVQPVGLVVSPSVLVEAQVVPDRNISTRYREIREILTEDGKGITARWHTPDPRHLFMDFLHWEDDDLIDPADHLATLEIPLPELQTVLSPTWAVPADQDSGKAWKMLIRVEDNGANLDKPPSDGSGWNATRHARFERLLRETGVPTGLLCTNERIRLIHAPRGESSGHLTFEFSQMALPAGRPILAAFDMLLEAEPLFSAQPKAQLPQLLARSRETQAEVSTRLSRQVLAALHELLRGFVAADARADTSTPSLAEQDFKHLYGGLVSTLMRLVFVLYAEDRGLMPNHSVYQQHYSLGGLFARLRADAAAWPDTMDQRFGAWAQLLSLFRLIHGGGGHGNLSFTARRGSLFDPDRFPFLEGRRQDQTPEIPMVPDSTVWKILRSLMVLDGERLSYRTLDVEQIGSVYEAIMGFRVELTTGRSIAITSPKRNGASAIIDIDSLLQFPGAKRTKQLQDRSDRKLPASAAKALQNASTIEDAIAALDRVIDRDTTPDIVSEGTPVLQPTDERRRSGSHYTPRSLTEPIVSEALRPIFDRLGPDALPEDILDLKVLDPATGSGAFLVEACRQISERLVKAWNRHGCTPILSHDEDDLLHARRRVAQNCLYGVDKNPMAIDLARLSLWLVTLARDHEFTFIDHALRQGDSLVGLSIRQIEGCHWKGDTPRFQLGLETNEVRKHVERTLNLRQQIRNFGNDMSEHDSRKKHDESEQAINKVRWIADMILSAFFEGDKPKERERIRGNYANGIMSGLIATSSTSKVSVLPLKPFHRELEFPEVYERHNPGFDIIIGNPPFAGKNTLAAGHPAQYPAWLKEIHPESHGNADLVAHFFRRAFNQLRKDGTLGLIATNTISQGDTRSTGLRWICTNDGTIYRASRRLKWPGEATVVVSVIHIVKGSFSGPKILDGKDVECISAFLFHNDEHNDPKRLDANTGKSFQGSIILGMGFTFDDTDKKGVATPLSVMHRLIDENPHNQKVIFPYIGGDEVNTSPTHAHHRFVINFRDWPLRRTDLDATWESASDDKRNLWLRDGIVPLDYSGPVSDDWPELLAIVEEKVKPERDVQNRKELRERWWHYARKRPDLHAAIRGLDRVLVISSVCQHFAFTFLPAHMIYANTVFVFMLSNFFEFCVLQSRIHEIWVRFFGSTLGDGLRYTASDVFETFPFFDNWNTPPPIF